MSDLVGQHGPGADPKRRVKLPEVDQLPSELPPEDDSWEHDADSFGTDSTYPQSPGDWEPHSCTETVPDATGCGGCKQRADLGLRPITKRARQSQLKRIQFEVGPTYKAVALGQHWIAICSWCGGLVLASGPDASGRQHTDWHKRTKTQ